jgi:NAD(P)-dependent dehydrogenase (short-subunit alcohol dehydrogenase family)
MITSANRGLGLEFARQYAADGWRIFAACRNPDVAAELQELKRSGSVTIFPVEVTDPNSIERAKADVANEPIDVLVSSAGIFGKQNQKTGNVDYESWKEVLDVNTLGCGSPEHSAIMSRAVNVSSPLRSPADRFAH